MASPPGTGAPASARSWGLRAPRRRGLAGRSQVRLRPAQPRPLRASAPSPPAEGLRAADRYPRARAGRGRWTCR